MSALIAISWEPELRGLLTVIISVVALCGSVYLLLGTNLGARLGFLVALAGLAGWMVLLGLLWWIFGIGLIGPDPTWSYVEGRTVIQNPQSLYLAEVVDRPIAGADTDDPNAAAAAVRGALDEEGWRTIAESDPDFGQASTAAGVLLQETGAFGPGEYAVTGLYEIGGERWPKISETFDFLAFFHEPRYALAEVSTLEPLRTEPGRAPTQALIDADQPKQYVYMVRDLGARRQPAAMMTIGSLVVFLALCWMLNRRDRFVAENRSAQLVPAG
jgi:hypothetical protein